MLTFPHHIYRLQIDSCLIQCEEYGTCGRPCYQQLVTHLHFGRLHQKLSHTDIGEVFNAFSHIYFTFGGFGTIIPAPFTQSLSQIITIPESAVKDCFQALIPLLFLFLCKRTFQIRTDSIFITFHHRAYILRPRARPSILNTRTPASIISSMK